MMAAPYYNTNTINNKSNSNSNPQHDNDATVVPSNPTLAILSGYGVTIWECLIDNDDNKISQQQREQLPDPTTRYPHGDLPISTLAWNHNRMVLATASDVSTDALDHPNIVLTSSQTGHQLDSFQHNQQWNNRPVGVANSVHFGGKSRYLCIGDETGAVCLWDLKKRLRVRQFFHDEYPSKQVSLDPTDTYVLSLSPETLTVYNLRDGILLGRMTPPVGQPAHFTKFHVSPLEPKLVVAGTTDGSVLLYDITNHDQSFPFFGLMRRHSGPVTGIAFSPIHPNIVVSGGEDGTVMMFDIKKGETVQQLCALSSPINSISIHSDGTICAVGCESGEVFIYDMRRQQQQQQFGDDPLMSLQVDGPVKQIQFAPPLRAKDQQMMFRSGTGSDQVNLTEATPAKFQMRPSPSSTTQYGLHVKTNIMDTNGHHVPNNANGISMQQSSESSIAYGAPAHSYTGPSGSLTHHNNPLKAGTTATSTPRNTDLTKGMNQQQQQQQQRQVLSPTRSTVTNMSSTGVESVTSNRLYNKLSPPASTSVVTSPRTVATTTSNIQQQLNGRQQQQQQQQPIRSPPKTSVSSPSGRIIMSRGLRTSPTKSESPTKVGSPRKSVVSPTKSANQSSNVAELGGINVVSSNLLPFFCKVLLLSG
jgi:WD40 repeat protein